MKFTVLLVLMVLPLSILAQNLTGTVVDKATGKPIAFASVSSSRFIVSTSFDGKFNIHVFPADSIRVTSIGYQTYKLGIGVTIPAILTIYLQQSSILLQSVVVKSKHDPKIDSVRLRKQFADVFEYRNPTFYDMFVKIDPYKYVPNNYINATNSTASLVSIDVLSVIDLLSKHKNPTSKLQRTLLQDEETTYVDRRFSEEKITSLTSLRGDSLIDFMADYRPDIKQVKKMSDYDIILYIKASYAEFVKTYDPKNRLFFGK